MSTIIPSVGELWKHSKTGKIYKIISMTGHLTGIGFMTACPIITYQAMYDDPHYGPNAIWFRSVNSWIDHISLDNTLEDEEELQVPRFVRIAEAPVITPLTCTD